MAVMITAVRPAIAGTRNGLPEPGGYVYRGTGEDTLTAFMDARKSRKPGPKRDPGRPLKPHGSMAAVRRHQRHKEPLCEPCRLKKNQDLRVRRGGEAAA